MKKSGKKLCALALAAAMLGLTACGSSSGTTDTTTAAAGGAAATEETTAAAAVAEGESVSQDTDIIGAVNVDFTTLDPLDTSDTLSGGVQRLIMDGLFGFDDEMKIIPMLATEYTANDSATEFTIKLREGITFSDGTPWNAEAAKANFDRWADKSLGLKRTTLLCNILDTTTVQDDYTIVVKLSSPFGAFIETLAHPACVVMSPKVIEQGSTACAEAPIGTGQYTFKEWIQGDHLTVELNKDWWGYDADICGGTPLADKDAGFKSITLKPVPESATRVAMIQSGDAQLIWPVPDENLAGLKSDPNVIVGQDQGLVVRYLMMNNQKKPFNDKKVRQAINYAINKEAYVAVVKNGNSEPGTSVIAPKLQYYKGNDPYPYDIEKAKSLLAEAGYPDGFKTTLIFANTSANMKQGEFLKQQLAEVGIDVELISLESAIVNEKVQDTDAPGAEAEVDMYIIAWSSSTGDADWGIRPLLAKESEPPMSYNICYFENEELDGYLKDGLNTADRDKRAEAYAKAQDLIWEESPLVCLATDFNSWATSNKMVNVKMFPDNCLNIRNGKMTK